MVMFFENLGRTLWGLHYFGAGYAAGGSAEEASAFVPDESTPVWI
jgi:hypothetical protein